MDPILFRGIERLLIAVAGVIFAYLGYRLYLHGITIGQNRAEAHSKFGKLILSGTGPGLFFMFFGAVILVVEVISGGASSTTRIQREGSEALPYKELQDRVTSLEASRAESQKKSSEPAKPELAAPEHLSRLNSIDAFSKENSRLFIEVINVLKHERPDLDKVTRSKIEELTKQIGLPIPQAPIGIPGAASPTQPVTSPTALGGGLPDGGTPGGGSPSGGIPGGGGPGGGGPGGGGPGGGGPGGGGRR